MRPFSSTHIKGTLFIAITAVGSVVYGDQQVKRAYKDPEYFYKNLDIDLKNEQPLEIDATTATGLKLRPARKTDLNAYRHIFGDPKTMATYLNGAEIEESTQRRLEMYENRVTSGYVWTGLAVEKYGHLATCLIGVLGPHFFHQIEKLSPVKPKTQIIGHIAVGNGDEAGEVQLGFVIGANIQGKNYQGQLHGTAASRAAAALTLFHIGRDKLVTVNGITSPVTTVGATARRDNIPSQKILQHIWGMRADPNKTLNDDQRQFWSTSVSELKKHTFSR